MKTTPFRLNAVTALFMMGTFLGLGLFIFNLMQAKFASALLTLGFVFSMMAVAVNPKSLFRTYQEPSQENGLADKATKNAHQLNLLMGVCYLASISVFIFGKLTT